MRYGPDTQITDIDTNVERYPLNDGIWTPAADIKLAWARLSLSSTGVSVVKGHGIQAVTRETSGILTVTYSVTFDALPVVVASAISQDNTATGRRYVIASDGVAANRYRTTSKQTFIIFMDDAGTIITDTTAHEIMIMIIGANAATTGFANRSTQNPMTWSDMNRLVTVGEYENPSIYLDTVFVRSAGYTTTTVNAGDTMHNVCNLGGAHTRSAAGDYETAFSGQYFSVPGAWATIIGNDTTCGYARTLCTVNKCYVDTSNGTNAVKADRNYGVICLGEAVIV